MRGKYRTKIITMLLIFVMACFFTGCGQAADQQDEDAAAKAGQQTEISQEADPQDENAEEADAGDEDIYGGETIDRDGSYDSKDEVALYLYTYGELPGNYITKEEARDLGWQGGSLEEYAPGKCIGGSYFGNYEGNLPDGDYHECDIDTLGEDSRGAKRLVYSDDEIYYTDDHYNTFEQLYNEDGKL